MKTLTFLIVIMLLALGQPCARASTGEITFTGAIVVPTSRATATTRVQSIASLEINEKDPVLYYFRGYAGTGARLITVTYN
jgi:hypothetical protein